MRQFFDNAVATAREVWDESNWVIRGFIIALGFGVVYSLGAAVVTAL